MGNPTPKKVHDKFVPFNYPIKSKEKLNRNFDKRKHYFLDVMMSRRSSKDFNPLSLKQLSELLYFSNKIYALYEDDFGFISTKRTAPSAGGRHPIDLIISMPKEKESRTLAYYNPIDHSLNELNIYETKLEPFFSEIDNNIPINNACIIWFSIQINKTQAKYENCESLYWKDCGALLYCIQLVSNYIGLKSCPLGSLSINSFQNLFESNQLTSGGGILIGE